MARQWILTSQQGFDASLEYQENTKVPTESDLGPNEVLVKMQAASLNYRDLMIAMPGTMAGQITPPVVPGCDGAGIVQAVGSSVKEFQVGDRVATHLPPTLAESSGDEASPSVVDMTQMLGHSIDGTLRSHAILSEKALVPAPKSLDWAPAATLTCTWVSAWNALFGIKGKQAGPGTWVLVQGTGGVSIAALQLAAAAGATVVATTSSAEKGARLEALGAKHTVNYRTNPDTWGQLARDLTPNKRGFDIIVDIGGNQTLPQSLAAVRVDGVVLFVGGVGGDAEPVPLFAAIMHTCIVRGILGGSRAQFKELVRFIDEKGIEPAVDDVSFELADAKGAYRRLQDKKHFSKVIIRIDDL